MIGSAKQPLVRKPGSESSTNCFNIYWKKHFFSDNVGWVAWKMWSCTPTLSIGSSKTRRNGSLGAYSISRGTGYGIGSSGGSKVILPFLHLVVNYLFTPQWDVDLD